MISKKQLKLLRYLYRKPRTVLWIKNKFKVSNLRDIASGMFTLIHATDGHYQDDCIISLSREGIIEVEQHQWFEILSTSDRSSNFHCCYHNPHYNIPNNAVIPIPIKLPMMPPTMGIAASSKKSLIFCIIHLLRRLLGLHHHLFLFCHFLT